MSEVIKSLASAFGNLLVPLIIVSIIQFILCKYVKRFTKVIPILGILYLFAFEFVYLIFTSSTGLLAKDPQYFLYGLSLAIPYSSFFVVTYIMHKVFKKPS